MTERIYFTSPDPDYFAGSGARVAPNEGVFPTDAAIFVETDSHFLEFEIEPRDESGTRFSIALVDALPPLPGGRVGADLLVKGDILKNRQKFSLVARGSQLAVHAFTAMSIRSNIEELVVPARTDDETSTTSE